MPTKLAYFYLGKIGFLRLTSGLAKLMSSSWLEPLMSVNIRPLLQGFCYSQPEDVVKLVVGVASPLRVHPDPLEVGRYK